MRRKSLSCFNLLLSHLLRCSSDHQKHLYFHSFRLVKLSQFLLLNPSSDHHSQCQSYSSSSSKLGSFSFFGPHFQSSKQFVLLGLVSLEINNKLHRHHYSSYHSKVLYFLYLCVCWKLILLFLKILLIFGGGGRFFYEGKASAEDWNPGWTVKKTRENGWRNWKMLLLIVGN